MLQELHGPKRPLVMKVTVTVLLSIMASVTGRSLLFGRDGHGPRGEDALGTGYITRQCFKHPHLCSGLVHLRKSQSQQRSFCDDVHPIELSGIVQVASYLDNVKVDRALQKPHASARAITIVAYHNFNSWVNVIQTSCHYL